MTTLTFKNDELAKLARITNIHGFGKEQPFNLPYTGETTKEAGFLLVKDEGIYVMNAFKHDFCTGKDENGNPIEKNIVSYADGFDPETNENVWEDSHHVSGDDFAEFVPISKEMLVVLGRGIGEMEIKITKSQIKMTVYECTRP
jgi:hypothetical protein